MKFPPFSYAFQPIVDISSKEIFSYEALIRGKNNEPANFIFTQVNTDDLMDFDQLARNAAIKIASELNVNCNLNLNFLPRCLQFSEKYITETIATAEKYGFPVEKIILEVIESEAIYDKNSFNKCINICRKLGIKIALDDFGAGHANLNILVDFLPDQIKLDMHLLRNIENHGPRQTIVKALMQVCTALGIDVIAEGVETTDEYLWLRDQNINLFQGYLFAKPGFESLPKVNYL